MLFDTIVASNPLPDLSPESTQKMVCYPKNCQLSYL